MLWTVPGILSGSVCITGAFLGRITLAVCRPGNRYMFTLFERGNTGPFSMGLLHLSPDDRHSDRHFLKGVNVVCY